MATYGLHDAFHKDEACIYVPRKAGMSEREFRRFMKGNYIRYLLPLSTFPTHPYREWYGRIVAIGYDAVRVEVLDEGYTGNTEIVQRSEIISVKRL